MKNHTYSLCSFRVVVLIAVLYVLALRPTMGKLKRKAAPSADKVFRLSNTLVRVGDFLAQHKFFERDRRKPNPDEGPLTFMQRFPDPPLDEIPLKIRDQCDKSVIFCLRLIYDLSYKRLSRMDLFTLRVSASYYMCWYTMHEEPELRHFGGSCQVTSPDLKSTVDYRGWDKLPFDCALHSFCPDPCCGFTNSSSTTAQGFAWSKKTCTEQKQYPCGITELACSLDFKNNRNWIDIQSNKLNTSCSCGRVGKGYIWEPRFRMCVDQDECRDGSFDCEPNSVCRNVESDYYCTCRLGYKFSDANHSCIRDEDFQMDDVLQVQAGQYFGMTSPAMAETAGFQWATYFYWLIDHSSYDAANRNQGSYSVAICTFVVIGVNLYQNIVDNN